MVDANIQITPNGTNPVGTTHTFTAHVNVNDGTGFANAPAGTHVGFTIDSGPGHVRPADRCTTVGAHGQLHDHDHLGGRRRHDRVSAHTT